MKFPQSLFFDENDYTLLHIVQDVLQRTKRPQSMSSLLASYLHPHGIKEMAAPQALRVAYAIAALLDSLEVGKSADRLSALRSLMDEVLLSATSHFRKNTARVLIQIMKELIRHSGDEAAQLRLAHDFRMASSGKPRTVRAELKKYHLLEMPEEWNQLAFDDRVHDANTKGRKSPTHLVMDAWIKGIRFLTVVYYNYVDPEVVEELLEAGAVLDMHIRVNVEVSARFRDKYVRMTWEPHGFASSQAFLEFLCEKPVREFMQKGRAVSAYQQHYTFAVLHAFNTKHCAAINNTYGLALKPLEENGFLRFVGAGQPSVFHLAKYIQSALLPELHKAEKCIRAEYLTASDERKQELHKLLKALNAIDSDYIIDHYLHPCRNPDLHDPTIPQQDDSVPGLLLHTPRELLTQLMQLHVSSRFTLNLSNLTLADTVEILYDCQGHVSHLEVYNLKDAMRGKWSSFRPVSDVCSADAVDLTSPEAAAAQVSDLQKALNEDNVIALKRVLRSVLWNLEEERLHLETQRKGLIVPENTARIDAELRLLRDRREKFLDILFHIESFHQVYAKRRLESRIGSGSTGKSRHQFGMGLVVLETLPARVQRKARSEAGEHRKLLPISASLSAVTKIHHSGKSLWEFAQKFLPGAQEEEQNLTRDWNIDHIEIRPGQQGNILTLGGIRLHQDNGLCLEDPAPETSRPSLLYLNTGLKNILKVVIGFIPAFLTFMLTKDWWVLAYLGAFIWFGITGVRNIIQSVLGGGGFRRSPLLQWNSLVSWTRIADSLLFTGFSVPLLDYLVKTLLLQHGLGITTATNPLLLYSVMALANGIYISSHNILRGLPRSAAAANFFRSILSIPIALIFNTALGSILHVSMVSGVENILQKWAAIISKLASDCVAAVIEGLADRQRNIQIRLRDYRDKFMLVFGVFAKLDMLFPEEDVLDMLQSPKTFIETISYEGRELETVFIFNGLDLMYFWMYQPRARKAMIQLMQDMTQEEWLIVYRSQFVLRRYREISQMFLDGLVGKDFRKALAFYLDHNKDYLQAMAEIHEQRRPHQQRSKAR